MKPVVIITILFQEKVKKAYSLLSKYVAPQLADKISDGQIDSIWKHNRKKLTLFFSDIKDFTSITDTLEPEDMANVLNEYLTEMNKRWFKRGIDEVLQIRCGINTGMATVGGYGSSERKEYTAMGMQTNIAARLEKTCKPGGILISHTTWALVNDEISCSEQGQINVKGLNRAIRTYSIDAITDEINSQCPLKPPGV